MIEENLVNILSNYGVLGLWTGVLLLERYNSQKNIMKIISSNTEALIKVKEVMNKCQR